MVYDVNLRRNFVQSTLEFLQLNAFDGLGNLKIKNPLLRAHLLLFINYLFRFGVIN